MALGRPRYLVDTSALARSDKPTVHERLAPLMQRGELAIESIVFLELLFSARMNAVEEKRSELKRTFTFIETDPADVERAAHLMSALAARGRHRSAGLADLLVAACAERSGLIVLHYDADFDGIASITGQPVEWVVARGSVP